MSEATVLVTGGSGFVGSHCLLQLLSAGYHVRTTVRSHSRESDVRGMLKSAGVEPADRISFCVADLKMDSGWEEAVSGCQYVLHVASPLPPKIPREENDLIAPAREGTLRVLRAAHKSGMKRVVMTSSFAAVAYGQILQATPHNETNWTNPDLGKHLTYINRTVQESSDLDFSVQFPF